MSSVMEQGGNEAEFNLREWAAKARMISRENTSSRRFSTSNIRSFREGSTRSFRSNVTISSTASSPGYTLTEEIDPSTYSFTAALKALRLARSSAYSWEYCSSSSPDGFALNSKWNEAEKYICNPQSGQVPMECLSAKTLSGRSFRSLAVGRITMSAPLIQYPAPNSHTRLVQSKSSFTGHKNEVHSPIQEKKVGSKTRDVGTQSTPPELSSSSPSPAPTPSIGEGLIKRDEEEAEDSPACNMPKLEFEEKAEVKETREKEETKRKEGEDKGKKATQMMCCRCRQVGCLSWKCLWMGKRQSEKHNSRKKNFFFHHMINGC